MARVALLCPDLLFGSRVEGGLTAAGHTVVRLTSEDALRPAAAFHDIVVIDLTDPTIDGPALVESMRAREELEAVPTLGFYSHVDVDTRRRAEAAGFSRVVPRSRMAREMGELVAGLLP